MPDDVFTWGDSVGGKGKSGFDGNCVLKIGWNGN